MHQAFEVLLFTQEKRLKVKEFEVKVNGFRDHVWIEVLSPNKKSILCGCVSRSPSNNINLKKCMRSADIMIELIKAAYERNNNLVIVGDFNYKQIDWDSPWTTTSIKIFNYTTRSTSIPTRPRTNKISQW